MGRVIDSSSPLVLFYVSHIVLTTPPSSHWVANGGAICFSFGQLRASFPSSSWLTPSAAGVNAVLIKALEQQNVGMYQTLGALVSSGPHQPFAILFRSTPYLLAWPSVEERSSRVAVSSHSGDVHT